MPPGSPGQGRSAWGSRRTNQGSRAHRRGEPSATADPRDCAATARPLRSAPRQDPRRRRRSVPRVSRIAPRPRVRCRRRSRGGRTPPRRPGTRRRGSGPPCRRAVGRADSPPTGQVGRRLWSGSVRRRPAVPGTRRERPRWRPDRQDRPANPRGSGQAPRPQASPRLAKTPQVYVTRQPRIPRACTSLASSASPCPGSPSRLPLTDRAAVPSGKRTWPTSPS